MIKNKAEFNQIQPEKNLGNVRSGRKSEEASFGKPAGLPQNGKRQVNEQPKNSGFFSKDKEKIKQMNELE